MNPEHASLTPFRNIHLNIIIDYELVILLESMTFFDSATNFKGHRGWGAGGCWLLVKLARCWQPDGSLSVHTSSPLDPILCQMQTGHNLKPHFVSHILMLLSTGKFIIISKQLARAKKLFESAVEARRKSPIQSIASFYAT
jgi:hypothetical protein